MTVFVAGFSGENIDSFCSSPGLGILFGLLVVGSGVPTGGKTISGSVNIGGELCGLSATGCSGVAETAGGGFGIPEWMVDR